MHDPKRLLKAILVSVATQIARNAKGRQYSLLLFRLESIVNNRASQLPHDLIMHFSFYEGTKFVHDKNKHMHTHTHAHTQTNERIVDLIV